MYNCLRNLFVKVTPTRITKSREMTRIKFIILIKALHLYSLIYIKLHVYFKRFLYKLTMNVFNKVYSILDKLILYLPSPWIIIKENRNNFMTVWEESNQHRRCKSISPERKWAEIYTVSIILLIDHSISWPSRSEVKEIIVWNFLNKSLSTKIFEPHV